MRKLNGRLHIFNYIVDRFSNAFRSVQRSCENMSGNRQFTWQELASMNLEHNAHIAINGKVRKASSFLLRYFAKTSITCIQYLMDYEGH